jgi:hypothetical protein
MLPYTYIAYLVCNTKRWPKYIKEITLIRWGTGWVRFTVVVVGTSVTMNAAPGGRTTPFSGPQSLWLDHGWATVGLRACQARQVSQIGPRQYKCNKTNSKDQFLCFYLLFQHRTEWNWLTVRWKIIGKKRFIISFCFVEFKTGIMYR